LDLFDRVIAYDGLYEDIGLITLSDGRTHSTGLSVPKRGWSRFEEIGKEGNRASWGKIHVRRSRWFANPIEWYRAEDALILIFDKSLLVPEVKGYFNPEKPEEYFGGADIDDPTSYLRFENSNRGERARAHFPPPPRHRLPSKPIDPSTIKLAPPVKTNNQINPEG
jgi:hypothetical protein